MYTVQYNVTKRQQNAKCLKHVTPSLFLKQSRKNGEIKTVEYLIFRILSKNKTNAKCLTFPMTIILDSITQKYLQTASYQGGWVCYNATVNICSKFEQKNLVVGLAKRVNQTKLLYYKNNSSSNIE